MLDKRWAAFAGRLKSARKRAGLTMREAANRIEVGFAAYAKWELGTRMPSDIDLIIALSTVLKVSPAWLAFGVGDAEEASVSDRLSRIEIELEAIRTLLERVFRS